MRAHSMPAAQSRRVVAGLPFVEALARRRPVGRIDFAQPLLGRLEPAALGAKKLDSGRFERSRISCGGQRRSRRCRKFIKLGEKIR